MLNIGEGIVRQCGGFTRREILQVGGLGALSLTLPDFWRLQAVQSLEAERKDDLHYSSVVNISAKDAEKLKAFLMESLTGARKIIDPSREEVLHGLCLDFFRISS